MATVNRHNSTTSAASTTSATSNTVGALNNGSLNPAQLPELTNGTSKVDKAEIERNIAIENEKMKQTWYLIWLCSHLMSDCFVRIGCEWSESIYSLEKEGVCMIPSLDKENN